MFGTILNLKNEGLQDKIYDILWFNLNLKDQKSIQMMLSMANKPMEFTYGLGKLNFETFVTVCK